MTAHQDVAAHLPLTAVALHVLLGLSQEPLNGYQLMARIEDNSDGTVSPGPGTLYERLHRMRAAGLVREAEAPEPTDGRRQKFHELTPLGRDVLTAELDRLAADLKLGRLALQGRGKL